MSSDELVLLEEGPEDLVTNARFWNVLIVDDEPEVHSVTRFALEDFRFKGRGIRLFNAYSGREAVSFMESRTDIALIIMDVVMESDSAGLDAIRVIRDEHKNWLTRIILRTGQPGQAPEQRVILNYDINDYKSKTELTATKLFSAVVTALRSYDDLLRLEESQQGLRRMLHSFSNEVIEQAVVTFLNGALLQIESLIRLSNHAQSDTAGAFVASLSNGNTTVVAATGEYESFIGKEASQIENIQIRNDIKKSMAQLVDIVAKTYNIYVVKETEHSPCGMFYFAGSATEEDAHLSSPERKLLLDFMTGVQSTSYFVNRVKSLATK
jgi:CheY-like chemotaxis protein